MVKLNIAHPSTGCQKIITVEDEREIHPFLDKRIAAEVPGDSLGDKFKGYVFKITGGYDKQGFAMKQGVLVNHRVRLLLGEGSDQFRPRRSGQKRRKSIRGCITSADMSMINLVVVKKGDQEIEGVTDGYQPRRLGPKRASSIRKLFNVSKEDDVKKYVIRRVLPPSKKQAAKLAEVAEDNEAAEKLKASFPKRSRAPKIQRLVTAASLQRKRHRLALKKRHAADRKAEQQQFVKLLQERAQARRESAISSRRSAISAKIAAEEPKKADAKAAAKPAAAPAKADAKKAAAAPAKADAKKAAAPAKADTKAAAKPAAAPAKADAKKADTKKAEAPKAAAKPAEKKPAAKAAAKPAAAAPKKK